MPALHLAEAEAATAQADVAAGADDDVIEHADVEQAAGLDDLGGDGYVLRRGGGVAAGVVVSNGDGCGQLWRMASLCRLSTQLPNLHA